MMKIWEKDILHFSIAYDRKKMFEYLGRYKIQFNLTAKKEQNIEIYSFCFAFNVTINIW
jgi:hypothetical protein